MKVYVVTWNQSYDGAIYQGVFATEEEANAWIVQDNGGVPPNPQVYEIIEEEIG